MREEAAGVPGRVEHDGARDLHLPHGGFPPVAGVPIGGVERHRQLGEPPLHEHVDGARTEPVADVLQRCRILAGGEPVGQLGEAETRLRGLAVGPFVAVEPDLARVGEVGAQLDERRTDVGVPQVEVVAGDPPVGLVERPARGARRRLALHSGPHPLELLRHPDRGHSRGAGGGLPTQVRGHHRELVIVLAERDPRDVVHLGEVGHRVAEPLPQLVEQRR
jgi:hypothetical protein